MHMITPGIAASLTPRSVEHPVAAPRARRRLHLRVPAKGLHLTQLHLPHWHA
jgi:hypothetical protein